MLLFRSVPLSNDFVDAFEKHAAVKDDDPEFRCPLASPRLASLARLAFCVAGTLGVLVFCIATARNHTLGIRVDSLPAFVLYVALPFVLFLVTRTAIGFDPDRLTERDGLFSLPHVATEFFPLGSR